MIETDKLMIMMNIETARGLVNQPCRYQLDLGLHFNLNGSRVRCLLTGLSTTFAGYIVERD